MSIRPWVHLVIVISSVLIRLTIDQNSPVLVSNLVGINILRYLETIG